MKAARRQSTANAAIAALVVLTGVAAGCGDDTTAPSQAVAPATTTADVPGPTSSVTSTSVLPTVDLDDGRVLLRVPEGLTFIDSRTKTGPFDETIRLWRYRGSKPVVAVTIAIIRGPIVVDMLHSETNSPSDVSPFEDREYFEDRNELAPLVNSKSLGWQIGPDSVIWVSATDLSIDEIADIASHVDVV